MQEVLQSSTVNAAETKLGAAVPMRPLHFKRDKDELRVHTQNLKVTLPKTGQICFISNERDSNADLWVFLFCFLNFTSEVVRADFLNICSRLSKENWILSFLPIKPLQQLWFHLDKVQRTLPHSQGPDGQTRHLSGNAWCGDPK